MLIAYPVIAPSAISFKKNDYPDPKAATAEYIIDLKQKWLDAVEKCKKINFDFIGELAIYDYAPFPHTDRMCRDPRSSRISIPR